MEHTISKINLICKLIELIASEDKISLCEARNKFFSSVMIDLIDDDETGLYGESALYNYSVYKYYEKKNA